jgi:hypothetical protein
MDLYQGSIFTGKGALSAFNTEFNEPTYMCMGRNENKLKLGSRAI